MNVILSLTNNHLKFNDEYILIKIICEHNLQFDLSTNYSSMNKLLMTNSINSYISRLFNVLSKEETI